jgi:hypothetical protein
MGVYEGRGNLGKSMKDLINRWQDAKLAWDDPVSHAIETEFLQPMEIELRATLGAMDQMAGILSQLRKDCDKHTHL